MKILVFSDIHGDLGALERLMEVEADYYFAAGDMVNWGRGLDAAGEVLARRAERTYVLPGNHETEEAIAGMCERHGLHAFHGQTIKIGGFHVAGLGYSSPTPFHTPGEYSEKEIAARLARFAGLKGEYSEKEIAARLARFAGLNPLVLICHSPPKDTSVDQVRPGLHAGSQAVRDFIEKHQPRYCLCGHIHEAHGAVTRLRAWAPPRSATPANRDTCWILIN